jgi:hypothetical protein
MDIKTTLPAPMNFTIISMTRRLFKALVTYEDTLSIDLELVSPFPATQDLAGTLAYFISPFVRLHEIEFERIH